MKKLMNKKGFTLIEMLVVIAIIAVLVAIIIPTVTSATDKAAAATDAANMRSYKAEIVTAYLSNEDTVTVTETDGTYEVTTTLPAPPMKKCGSFDPTTTATWAFAYDGNDFTLTCNEYTLEGFAAVADGTIKASAMTTGYGLG